jgi:hypothetical protein
MLQRQTMLSAMVIFVLASFVSCSGAQQLPPRAGSVLWNATSGSYSFTPSMLAGSAAAWGSVQDTRVSNGWATLTIESNTAMPVAIQHSAAGVLEGILTADMIDEYGVNQYLEWGFLPTSIPQRVQSFMLSNLLWMRTQAALTNYSDPVQAALWADVSAALAQYDGLVLGYTTMGTRSPCLALCNTSTPMPPSGGFSALDLLMLNAAGDLETLIGALSDQGSAAAERYRKNPLQRQVSGKTDCSGLVSVLPSGDIAVAHATWRSFKLMNRVYKYMLVGGLRLAFSSQPGFLSSKDDFYISGSQLAIFETTNEIFNATLYDLLSYQSLLCWIRSLVASRLAKTGAQWVDLFSLYNSGTYNNQWVIVDLGLAQKLRPQLRTPAVAAGTTAGLMWVLEQIPGRCESADLSEVLLSQRYWPSYNVPYFPSIFQESGYPPYALSYPQMFNYVNASRARIFAQRAPQCSSLADVQALIRYNGWAFDPISQGNPGLSISSRFDLCTAAQGASPFGAQDGKITSGSMLQQPGAASLLPAAIVMGPTWSANATWRIPPFSWAAWPGTVHVGQPTQVAFDWVASQWNQTEEA